MRDLSGYRRPQGRVVHKLLASMHKGYVCFDYQQHNFLYHLGVLNRCMHDPHYVQHFISKIEEEIKRVEAA